ncbi:MAG: helix-turn-helix transcriptional regulator [Candidatus Aminicenantes bacterium]|nr:MAG: helix-turn-helix transcriptional regulator [Candidatus Aminicenantes bacterium]
MKELTKIEEILMLAIWRLQDDAYGVKIRQYVSQILGKEFTYGNLYSALSQLAKKKYVNKSLGDPTPDRRGRRKIYYTVSTSGLNALKAARDMNQKMWEDITDYAFD